MYTNTPKMVTEIIKRLHKVYKKPRTELENWKTPIQFMVCTILSAQATDKGVNKVTKNLFSKYRTVQDFANSDIAELETYINSINYYKTKAKRIISASQFVIKSFGGNLPNDGTSLAKIPGIGGKSANVILNEAFGRSEGIVVDTHVTRLTYRLGLTGMQNQKDAKKIEKILINLIDKNEWRFFSGAAVLHGRYVCKAKKPNCKECVLNDICPSAFSFE